MMTFLSRSLFRTSTAIALGVSFATPSLFSAPAIAQRSFFSDVSSSYWAKPFIETLSREGVMAGFADGTFRPEQVVTRAQFAAILRSAFSQDPVRKSRTFKDVPAKYWANAAISKAYTTGFMSGYPDNTFRPEQKITKAQTLTFLSNGLQLDPPKRSKRLLSIYRDADEIAEENRLGVAAATENGLVVNYPKTSFLGPNDEMTRAEVAAAIYQALVSQDKLSALPTNSKALAYIVKVEQGQGSAGGSGGNTGSTGGSGSSTTGSGSNTGTIQNGRLVARGTAFAVRMPGGNDVKLILAPTDTVATNLEVAQSIASANGTPVIPVGSQIQGRFQPVSINGTGGSQYFADRLIVDGKTYAVSLSSDPIAPTSKQSLSPSSVQGGLSTLAGRLLLGRIFGGGIDLGSLLGGVLGGGNSSSLGGLGGLGGLLGGNSQSNEVVVVEPSKLLLKLQSDTLIAHQLGGGDRLAFISSAQPFRLR
jgi:S-layer homology domain